MQDPDVIVRPEGTISLPLNQTNNASFTCECIVSDDHECQIFWSLANKGVSLSTLDDDDKVTLFERGITCSRNGTTAFITIPDTEENNNTMISCLVLFSGGTYFSDSPVTLIIIGESE